MLNFDLNNSGGTITHNATDPSSVDSYLVKLNSNGSFIWGVQFSIADIRKITTDAQGNIYCTGSFSATTDFDPSGGVLNLTANGFADAFTVKLNSSGSLNWVRKMGITSSYNEGRSIALDIFGNVYTVGNFSGSNVDFDPGSGITTLSSVGEQDYYIQKLDNNGNFIWAVGAGSAFTELAWDITIDGNGKCYVTGTMQDSGDIDPTAGTDTRTGSGIFFNRLSNFTTTNPVTSNAVVTASTLSDNGNNIPVIFQNQSGIVSAVTPSGNNPVIGQLTAKVWINTTGYGSYLNKNYEITPQTNPNTATGKIAIYFTQAEFDAYNATSTIDLPSSPTDASGKANLKIDKFSGTSSDNSGSPASYAVTPTIIDPDDNDIVWNATLNRWEVSFQVTGFSGFFIKSVAPAICLLNYTNATGNWGTAGIWSCGHIPLATEPVQISAGHTITLNVNGAAKSLDLRGILNKQATKVLLIQGN
jgi:hypothetical protein